jgi:hypothetical protein
VLICTFPGVWHAVLSALSWGHPTSTSAEGAAAIDTAAATVNNIGGKYFRLIIVIIHSFGVVRRRITSGRSPRSTGQAGVLF